MQGLQSGNQRKRSVGEQTQIRDFQICRKFLFQLLMKTSVIRYPLACPYFLEKIMELFQIRQKRRCYCYDFLIHKTFKIYARLFSAAIRRSLSTMFLIASLI